MPPPVHRFATVLAAMCLLLAGCTHYASVTTEPPGAKIEAPPDLIVQDGRIEARTGLAESYVVHVSAPGYRTREFVIQRTYRADLSLFLLLFGIFPYFMSARLDEEYHFPLARMGEPTPPPTSAPGTDD
ncbi:MAG: hypothetical protein HY720_06040 [Planctomycetes bacterium]|nr:hypothetical protein [Planctomycetota bacterium]